MAMESESTTFALQGTVWMTVGGEKFGGPGRVELLAAIAQTGSISQAAKALGVSYKGAWDAIDAMNNLAGEALVERVAGGKGGGGTRLTARGEQLVRNFRAIEQLHQQFVEQLNQQAGDLSADLTLHATSSSATFPGSSPAPSTTRSKSTSPAATRSSPSSRTRARKASASSTASRRLPSSRRRRSSS
jgi:molybdate transport repressor ModE-like protein